MAFIQIITTVDSKERADLLAELIVSQRLAACAQRIGPIRSTYWWNGKLEHTEEWQLLFKTSQRLFSAVEGMLKDHHPYEVPEILAVPVLQGKHAYLDWIAAQVESN